MSKNRAGRAIDSYPIDDRYMFWDGEAYRPYDTVAEACENIDVERRHLGLLVVILNRIYWFRNGVTDSDLIPLDNNLVESQIVDGPPTYELANGNFMEYIIVKPSSDCTLRIDTLGGGIPGDILIEQDITTDGIVASIMKMAWVDLTLDIVGLPDNSIIYYLKRKIY